MLFDLLQVASDMGRQIDLLLSGIQQQQQRRNQTISLVAQSNATASRGQRASQMSTLTGEHQINAQVTPRPSVGRNRQRLAPCRPLDLSIKPSSCESQSSPEINNNERDMNQRDQEEAPLNLVKNETKNHLGERQGCASSVSPSSSSSLSIFSLSSFNSNAICHNQLPKCDNNNNSQSNNSNSNNHNEDSELKRANNGASHFDDPRTSSNEIQISSTNGRQPRRRGKKLTKGLKSHLCQQCGRSFSRSDMLMRHSRLHSGLKPYQCAKCLQVFSRSDHLSTHERTHTGEKPYQCNFCSYSACRRDMITRHLRTHTLGRLGAQSNRSRKGGKARQRSRRHLRMSTISATQLEQQQQLDRSRDDDVSTSAEISLMPTDIDGHLS